MSFILQGFVYQDILFYTAQTFWDFFKCPVMFFRIIRQPQTFRDFLKRVLNVFLRKCLAPLGPRPPFGGGINKIIDKHPYIQYKGYIPDLTNDILFDTIPMNLEKYLYFVIMFYKNIQGFWGYFVMVLNTFLYKGLSDMSVLYVFAGPFIYSRSME